MNMKWMICPAVLLLCFASTAIAQEKLSVEEKIIKEGRENSKVMDHLDHMVNKIGPRLTSSDNLTRACEWSRDQFTSFGLEARLEEWGTFPVGFNRGRSVGRMVEPVEKKLEFGTNAWTAGTDGLVRGPAVMAPKDADELEEIRGKLKGAWVLQRGRISPAMRTDVQEAYADAKIAGIVRRIGGELILTSGRSRISFDNLPKRVSVRMSPGSFDAIVEQMEKDADVVLEFDIKNEFKEGPIKQYNVIADIPGSEKPDEYVIVGGHIDSWDGATGTTDNGTGCATTIEAARLLMKAGAKPKRTIRFMLWGGEEQGLLGSRAYVKAHPELMPKISGVFVHDGGTNYLGGIIATKPMVPIFEKVFEPVMKLNEKMPFEIREVNGLRGGGSDHASFLGAGVPGFFWTQKGRANYRHTHHTQHDTYDQAIPEYQKHSAMVVALGALGVANADELLSRENLRASGGRRRLGINVDEDGVTISTVSDGMPAKKAGLKKGDVILKIGETKVEDRASLLRGIRTAPQLATIVIKRDGKELKLKVDFGRR